MTNSPHRYSLLVVDDSEATREVLRRTLEAVGYQVLTAGGVPQALELLENQDFDLVITDVHMPRVSGLDLVRHIRENFPTSEVMVITGYPNVDGAVAAMKLGATEYLTKPFTDDELLEAVIQTLQRLELRRAPSPPPTSRGTQHGLLGSSPAMEQVFSQIQRAARSPATVLISGESGTGKELVARAIHYESSRAAAPFVPVNCGAIPQDLFESELFGHIKGSFTGAVESRAGFFLTAEGGSLFLDEIAETTPATQVKLLRVLQDREVRMVGSSRSRQVDVRILCATNKDLEQMVSRGCFRSDLFFRINVIQIYLPPLRERGPDLLLLLRHFTEKFARESGRAVPQYTDQALNVFQQHSWPGNVRELENVVQRLVVMTEGDVIDAPDLPSLMRFSAAGKGEDLRMTLAQADARYIRRVLQSVGSNKTQAAQILGIDRKTLRSKLAEASES